MNKTPQRQRAFTLIEVMIALVILAVGLLGMASLMTRSQQSTESAYMRSQATLMAYDIIERMRSNLVDPVSPNKTYKTTYATESPENANQYALNRLPEGCGNTTGTPAPGAARAIHDLASWCTLLRSSLPAVDSANTSITIDTSELNTLGVISTRVNIAWTENSINGPISENISVATTL